MAVHAPIIADATCAPGNSTGFAPTRRALVRALAPIALASVPAAAAVVSGPSGPDTVKWDTAYAAYRVARDKAAWFDETVYDPVADRIMHETPHPSLDLVVVATNGQKASYRLRPADFDTWAEEPAFRKGVHAIRDAYNAFKRDRAALEAQVGYHALAARKEQLENEWFAAEAALLKVPAPHAAALSTKVLICVIEDCMMSDFHTATLHADAKRLGGNA